MVISNEGVLDLKNKDDIFFPDQKFFLLMPERHVREISLFLRDISLRKPSKMMGLVLI